MDTFSAKPLEPVVDPRWEHLVLALTEWGALVSAIAAHQSEYHAFGPDDGAELHAAVADCVRRFIPAALESVDQTLIDDTALGVNLVQSWFARELLFVPKGKTPEDLLGPDPDEQPPRNRAERRGRRARRR